VRKYIGSYMAALGGDVSALIFSAGIGENSSIVRDLITAPLKVGACHTHAWFVFLV
jgi:acetate kinase